MSLLIPEVFIILLTDSLFSLLLIFLLPNTFQIAKSWNIENSSEYQYLLEKKRHLTSTVIKFIFIFKIPLFLFYIYTNDKLANVLTGAMCAAGSVNATDFGSYLIYTKIFNVFIMSVWLTCFTCNNRFETLPYTRINYKLLLFVTLLLCIETLLSFLNFMNIDPTAVVSCCSSIYSGSGDEASLFASTNPFHTFAAFILVSLTLFAGLLTRNTKLTAIFSILFFLSGVLNLTFFTSTYIYELPSHRCPYCILQKEYGYIGYLFYISLFASVSAGINSYIYKRLMEKKSQRLIIYCTVFSLIFFFLSIYFPISYYIVNNLWL